MTTGIFSRKGFDMGNWAYIAVRRPGEVGQRGHWNLSAGTAGRYCWGSQLPVAPGRVLAKDAWKLLADPTVAAHPWRILIFMSLFKLCTKRLSLVNSIWISVGKCPVEGRTQKGVESTEYSTDIAQHSPPFGNIRHLYWPLYPYLNFQSRTKRVWFWLTHSNYPCWSEDVTPSSQ